MNEANDNQTAFLRLDQFLAATEAAQLEPVSGVSSLTTFIRKAVAETVAEGADLVLPRQAAGLNPQKLLGTVSYCYAKNVYESAQIEQRLRRNDKVQQVLGDMIPNAAAIRRFRRLNREAIRSTLERAFRSQRRQQRAQATPASPVVDPATNSDGGATAFFTRQEAERRIENAMFMDSMADED